MNQSNPPQLPPGWIACWDESAQRYYYLNQATGTTQWELPNEQSHSAEAGISKSGEADSYASGYASSSPYPQQQQGNSPYPQQQQGSNPYPQQPGFPDSNSYNSQHDPNGQQGEEVIGPNGERGMGKIFKGFSGGAITGTLIGLAAGKYLGNHGSNNHNQGGYSNYGPPPQSYGGYGPPQGNYGPPQGNYGPPPPGYGGYGKPPKKHSFF